MAAVTKTNPLSALGGIDFPKALVNVKQVQGDVSGTANKGNAYFNNSTINVQIFVLDPNSEDAKKWLALSAIAALAIKAAPPEKKKTLIGFLSVAAGLIGILGVSKFIWELHKQNRENKQKIQKLEAALLNKA